MGCRLRIGPSISGRQATSPVAPPGSIRPGVAPALRRPRCSESRTLRARVTRTTTTPAAVPICTRRKKGRNGNASIGRRPTRMIREFFGLRIPKRRNSRSATVPTTQLPRRRRTKAARNHPTHLRHARQSLCRPVRVTSPPPSPLERVIHPPAGQGGPTGPLHHRSGDARKRPSPTTSPRTICGGAERTLERSATTTSKEGFEILSFLCLPCLVHDTRSCNRSAWAFPIERGGGRVKHVLATECIAATTTTRA